MIRQSKLKENFQFKAWPSTGEGKRGPLPYPWPAKIVGYSIFLEEIIIFIGVFGKIVPIPTLLKILNVPGKKSSDGNDLKFFLPFYKKKLSLN